MRTPGTISFIGSGETASTGGQIFEMVAMQLPEPLTVSVLETPAGFEVNAQRVAGRVADFLSTRLQNYKPQVDLIAARKKGTQFSPDSETVVRPLYQSQLIFFGPGSPTYTVRQLQDSLAWNVIQARHRLGASLVLASAATISISKFTLPVYEIYKVGEDVHWKQGLNLLEPFGLSLVVVPHWNNREGGDEVDTSRCFMGQERFSALQSMLPDDVTVVGVDEHTAVTINFDQQECRVYGVGEIHILHNGSRQTCAAGCSFSIFELGNYHPLSNPEEGLHAGVWEQAVAVQAEMEQARSTADQEDQAIPEHVQALVDQRQEARRAKDWKSADRLRAAIAKMGWQVQDTPGGPVITRGE